MRARSEPLNAKAALLENHQPAREDVDGRHSDVRLALSTYAHVVDANRAELAGVIDTVLTRLNDDTSNRPVFLTNGRDNSRGARFLQALLLFSNAHRQQYFVSRIISSR